jgi:methylmalonyl-CoA mutase C-terminal domain/subunit
MEKRIRILVAKPGLDGHDVGAKVVVRALMDAGFDVVYSGLRRTPRQIVEVVRDNDIDVVGLSILSGSHLPLCRKLRDELKAHDIDNKLWIVGGNIPAKDHEALKDMGVDAIFPTSSRLDDIVAFIREQVSTWPRN